MSSTEILTNTQAYKTKTIFCTIEGYSLFSNHIPFRRFSFFRSALLYTLTITGQTVRTQSYPFRTSTVIRSLDVNAIMAAATISVRAFVSIYREYTIVLLKGFSGQSFLTNFSPLNVSNESVR